jgi:integrase
MCGRPSPPSPAGHGSGSVVTRAAFGTRLQHNSRGFPLNLVQAQLGHSSLATTDRYLRHIAPQQLIDAVQRRAWDV